MAMGRARRRTRAGVVALGAFAVVMAAFVQADVPVQAESGSSDAPCGLLEEPEVLAVISGAGEAALRRHCAETSPGDASAPVGADSLGTDTLVNDRSVDEYPHITQSETSVAVGDDAALVGFNDSGEVFREGDFIGYALMVSSGMQAVGSTALPSAGPRRAASGNALFAPSRGLTSCELAPAGAYAAV